jgi:hypothetical protein
MYLKIIFFFILFPILSSSQSYVTIGIKENHNIKEVRIGDEVINNEEPYKFFTYIYSCNKTKDTIFVYKQTDLLNFDNADKIKFILKKESSNDAELTITNSDNSIKKLKIRFIDKLKSININESSYFLNTEYYLYLKKNLNISELVDLLDDFLQEDIYQINDLKFIKSKTKYRNNKFRILNAKMKTVNSQNENLITNWQIFYSYNKNNILTSVKQKTKDEVRYTKILISNISNVLSYQIYWQVDERFSDDKKETFDITQNAYCEKGTYLQIGLNREEDYEKRITKSIYQTSSTLELSKNEIIRILKEMAQKNN